MPEGSRVMPLPTDLPWILLVAILVGGGRVCGVCLTYAFWFEFVGPIDELESFGVLTEDGRDFLDFEGLLAWEESSC